MTNPSATDLTDSIDDPAAAALRAENPEMFGDAPKPADGKPAAEAATPAADAAKAGDAAAAGTADAAAAAAAAAGDATDAAKAEADKNKAQNMVPQSRVDEMAAERRELARRVQQLEQQEQQRLAAESQRKAQSFETQHDENQRRYDEGEIDQAEFNRETRKIDRAERAYELEQNATRIKQETLQQQALMSWNDRITQWKGANADFINNPIRRSAMDAELTRLGNEEPDLTDEDLIKRAEVTVFEAFNYTPAAKKAGDPVDPKAKTEAERRAAQAVAIAGHSALPARPDGGVGTRGVEAQADPETLSRDEWAKLPEAEKQNLLGLAPAQ